MGTLLYPIFEECKKYTLDSYWKDILSDCSINRFPMGARYDPKRNTLTIKTKSHSSVHALPTEPVELYTVLVKIFREELGLKSDREVALQRDKLERIIEARNNAKEGEWKKIKTKLIRDEILMEFTEKLCKEYKLSGTETRKLHSLISLGFQFKSLISDDVVYEDGQITEIRGLEFDEKKKKFFLSSPPIIPNKSDRSTNKDKMYSFLDKFIRSYNTKRTKTNT